MSKYDITVVGTAATVSVLRVREMPESGKSTAVFGGSFLEFTNGGVGLNFVSAFARLGLSVYPVLTYVDERQREFLHTYAREQGMPEDGIQDPPEGSVGTTVMIQDDKKNHMTLITNYLERLPTSTYYKPQKMEDHFFSDSRLIVLTPPMAVNTRPALEAAVKSGVPICFSMRRDPIALPDDVLIDILKASTVIFANEEETEFITETFGMKNISDLFDSGRAQVIVETLGPRGSRALYKDSGEIREVYCPAVKPDTDEIETVGAGDAFASGFLFGYINGYDIKTCSEYGNTLSSFVLETEGSISNLPSEEQLVKRWQERC